MNLASAYAAISTLSILTVDDGMELCVDFYRFKVEGPTAKSSRHVHCPDNSTVQGDVAEYKLYSGLNFTKHFIMPQNTEVGTVLHAGEHLVGPDPYVAFSMVSAGRDPTYLKSADKHGDVLQISTSNGHVFYQECKDGGKARYILMSANVVFETLNRNDLQVCGLTFGHTSDGLIWESQGKCRKLVVEGKSASLKREACPKVEKLVFSMAALKNRAPSTKGELPDAEVDTTLAVLYLKPKPVTTTTTPEPTTEIAETAVSNSTTEGSDTSTVSVDPWMIGLICVVVGISIGIVVALVVFYKMKGKRTHKKSKKRKKKTSNTSSDTSSNIKSNISNITSNTPADTKSNIPAQSPTPKEEPKKGKVIVIGKRLVPETVDANGNVIPAHYIVTGFRVEFADSPSKTPSERSRRV
ncbi:unnamed protein product [Bursaphelenchus okinawaensis]|uniref:Uncharacterized protein n=1 Tax=Bursaphelenchus okinawaensis TaxID=465554 RepID=A0A811JQN6_9BILA|nr:unnamed protein product [Bursaphelenchus okinawaensis]CAG9077600.1 unnamed protein product [Bursaphelenchus okinawaensis]